MTCIGMADVVENNGGEVRVMSAIEVARVTETFARKAALRHLADGRILFCAGGTGNPFCSHDLAAVLRGLELDCDYVVK